MQLTIKNATKGNGANGANGTDGAHVATPVDGTLPPNLFRTLKGSAGDIREALLQILSGATPYLPRIQVRETNTGFDVTATLAGIDEDSLEVSFDGRLLRIHGTKIDVSEQTRRKYHRVLRVSRTFDRAIPIYGDVDRDKAVATLRKEILRIHVPKAAVSLAKPVRITTESTSAS